MCMSCTQCNCAWWWLLYYRSGTWTLTDPYKTLYIYVGMCSSHSIYHIQVHILPGPVTVSLSSEVPQTEDRIITGDDVQRFWDGILDKWTWWARSHLDMNDKEWPISYMAPINQPALCHYKCIWKVCKKYWNWRTLCDFMAYIWNFSNELE